MAQELGYSPHAMARLLTSPTSTVLGVLVYDLHNVFFAEVVDGLDAVARAEGFELIITTGARSMARERTALAGLLSFHPAGVALLGTVVPAAAIATAALRVPVMLVSRSLRGASADTVNDDGYAGLGLAVDHLVSLGHTRIAHLDGGHGAQSGVRRRGYVAAMHRRGLSPYVVRSEYTEAGGAKAVHELLHGKHTDPARIPTAIVGANDLSAIGAIRALEEAGRRVPDDVSVVGYDNTSLAALRHISLTTINQPRAEMGQLAAEALLERVRGVRTAPVRHLLRPSLVVRSTTGKPPGGSA